MDRRSLRPAAAAWLLVAAAGCGATAQSVVEEGHTATFRGALESDQELTWVSANKQIALRHPEPEDSPAIPWRDAFRQCFIGRVRCAAEGNATVFLARVDGPDGYPSANGKLFADELAYVIVWDPAPCTTTGGQAGRLACRVVNLVPETTAAVTFAFEIDARTTFPR